MDNIADQWDKMAHFYASISYEHSTASVSLKKLSTLDTKNEFYKVNLQLGIILKTENALKNMIDHTKRRERHKVLLKAEEMHQMAKDVSYGNRGNNRKRFRSSKKLL